MEMVAPIGSVAPSLGLISETTAPTSQVARTFGAYMQNAAVEAVGTVRDGEITMAKGLIGEAGPQEVVNAVIAAETTVETVIAIRDKAISAYNDILRMPI